MCFDILDGWTDGQMDRWTDGQTDRQIEKIICGGFCNPLVSSGKIGLQKAG
jgi:hypothetical protein